MDYSRAMSILCPPPAEWTCGDTYSSIRRLDGGEVPSDSDLQAAFASYVPTVTYLEQFLSSATQDAMRIACGIPSVASLKGDTGATGAAGTTGAPGSTGAAGSTGPSGVVSVTSPITNSGTSSSATIGLSSVGIAGTYSTVTTDAFGRVASGKSRTITNSVSLVIQTVAAAANGAQVSATQDASVSYTIPTSTTSTISGPASVIVVLEICPTNSATAANWVTIASVQNSQTVTLAVALQVVQALQQVVCGFIPAGYFRRLRSTITGTGTASTGSGQEVLT